MLEVPLSVFDPNGDSLITWVENLPPGAIFDTSLNRLSWVPGSDAAGTYGDVRFVASDGHLRDDVTATILVAPTNQPPTLIAPAALTAREGDTVRFILQGNDADGDLLNYDSPLLPGGSLLNPNTGLFTWTPAFYQAGDFEIPFFASDGTTDAAATTTITVLNENAPPVFDTLDEWIVQEGQGIRFTTFAFDPDNPDVVPQVRLLDGSLHAAGWRRTVGDL